MENCSFRTSQLRLCADEYAGLAHAWKVNVGHQTQGAKKVLLALHALAEYLKDSSRDKMCTQTAVVLRFNIRIL